MSVPVKRLTVAAMVAALACSVLAEPIQSRATTYRKLVSGASVRLPGGQLFLTVFDVDTIRIQFVPANKVAGSRVPTLVRGPKSTKWTFTGSKKLITVATADVRATVSLNTGLLTMTDHTGRLLLRELPSDRCQPTMLGAIPSYKLSERFLLQPSEAIYGLGQHQQGLMNYRGSTVHLQQENREVAIPMMLSSRGYGLLWNNPSVTDVNVAGGTAMTVDSSMLSDETGQPGGLTGRYYTGIDFGQLVGTRKDAQIDFNWTEAPPEGLPKENYSVRWSGFLQVPTTGYYTLLLSGDDGVRLRIDDKVVAEDWAARPLVTLRKKLHLVVGQKYKLGIDFYQATRDSIVKFAMEAPAKEQVLSWTSEAGYGVDYFFCYGPSLEGVIASYRSLTGDAPMFGRWAFGLWQSRERYASSEELLDVASRYRKAKIPLDGIIQDWQYWRPNEWGSHDLDHSRYPDPEALLEKLHAEKVHSLISVWPKFHTGLETSNALTKVGAMFTKPVAPAYPAGDEVWYDPFNPVGRTKFWDLVDRKLAIEGWDGWWLDASEGEFTGNWGEFRNFDTAMGPGALVYNAYPFMHTLGVYQGGRESEPDKRPIILTRSAYLGQQRNGAITWSGDIDASWQTLKNQIPAGLNFSMSGIPYWNTDTGGFFAYNAITTPEYQDLFSRWFEFSTFVPMLRIHGTGVAKEIWRWPEPTRSTLTQFDELRYHLLPYIYTSAWQVTSGHSSMMRALVLDFLSDPKVREIPDEYMFGRALLVAPVVTPNSATRAVYLPKGTIWVDFWTGKKLDGGQSVSADAAKKIPIFVRAGSIVPYGPKVQNAEEKEDPTEIRIYPGANGSLLLYNDEGDGNSYLKGKYSLIRFTWNDRTGVLTIGSRTGSYSGMPLRRHFRIVVVRPGVANGIDSSGKVDKNVTYTGEALTVNLAR